MIKQVIVIRKDLKMRRGKECAQASHASMAWLSHRLRDYLDAGGNGLFPGFPNLPVFNKAEKEWLTGLFTKVVCQVNSEQELLDIVKKSADAGLVVHAIQDSGATEFHGVPTYTCCGIGPDEAEKIDLITKELKLY